MYSQGQGPQGPYPQAPYPQQQQQPPYYAPPPKKGGSFIVYWLAGSCLLIASCAAYCGYAVYESGTPEGKKAAKDLDDKNNATLDGFATKLSDVYVALPDVDAPAERCPSDTKIGTAPVVDTFFIQAVAESRADAAALVREPKSELLRTADFSDSILDAEAQRGGIDAGLALVTTSFGTSGIEIVGKNPYVVVFDVDSFDAPSADSSGWEAGAVSGALDVVEWSSGKTICHVPITAQSSDEITYGGGMQLKFHGIPSPTVGKTDLDEAVDKDFTKNVEAARKAALASIGAS